MTLPNFGGQPENLIFTRVSKVFKFANYDFFNTNYDFFNTQKLLNYDFFNTKIKIIRLCFVYVVFCLYLCRELNTTSLILI